MGHRARAAAPGARGGARAQARRPVRPAHEEPPAPRRGPRARLLPTSHAKTSRGHRGLRLLRNCLRAHRRPRRARRPRRSVTAAGRAATPGGHARRRLVGTRPEERARTARRRAGGPGAVHTGAPPRCEAAADAKLPPAYERRWAATDIVDPRGGAGRAPKKLSKMRCTTRSAAPSTRAAATPSRHRPPCAVIPFGACVARVPC
mmetsp:Transcript_28901/g.97452  ORF Transcript_28901/g.97452 Transcript_28901/m.97452 type:complete len:204 (-) Transcript_28901:165-776(-)